MKRIVFLLVFMVFSAFSQDWPAVTNFTYYWNPQAGDTVTFGKWSANNDSVRAGTGRIIDELNKNVLHFNSGASNHDSVVHYMRIDTIRSNPDVDSLHGNPWIDTVTTPRGEIDHVETDSIHSSGGIVATTGDFSGTVNVDSIHSTKAMNFTDIDADTVTADKIVTDTVDFGSGADFVYSVSAVACTVFIGTSEGYTTNTYMRKFDDMVFIYGLLSETLDTDSTIYIKFASTVTFPTGFNQPITVYNGSNYLNALLYRSGDSSCILKKYDGTNLTSAVHVINFTIVYREQ